MMCIWQKIYNGYSTDCGHTISVRIRGGVYCPFCGGEIQKHREEYQKQYYTENRERLSAMSRENYRKRKRENDNA